MARAGTQRWRNPAPEGDDVQRSIELLDKVLSEYDEYEIEVESGSIEKIGGGGGGVRGIAGLITDCSSSTERSIGLTPDDESPSLGNQSEDDGYMSMNGRKAKMALVALRPVPDCPEPQDLAGAPAKKFPPPPEEAERIISTLLPMVSPGNLSKSAHQHQLQQQSACRGIRQQQWMDFMEDPKYQGHAVTTQTTLPKTRHQRPYGWKNNVDDQVIQPSPFADSPSLPRKFASLPYDAKVCFNWIGPRIIFEAKQREVRHQYSEDVLEKLRQSSEDGLDEEDEAGDDGDDGDEEDDDDGEEIERNSGISGNSRSEIESTVSAHNNHHHHYRHNNHPSWRRPPRQTDIIKSSSVEDRLLMNNYQQMRETELLAGYEGSVLVHSNLLSSSRRCRNNSDSSDGRFSRNSESERSSLPRSSSVSVERFSMRANCDSSDFSRANSISNERFHSDFSIAVASISSNDHVSVPSSEPFAVRNLDFVNFGLPHTDSSEHFFGRASDRYSEERYSEAYSTRNSDFSTRNSADFRTQSEEEHFSDDSLEELLPPQQTISKRHSIAWEVSLDDEALYAPGSTKVIGRRRRKSSDLSSFGSASKLRDFDDWQDPRISTTDDDLISLYSDSSTNDVEQLRPQEIKKNGTYIIRRGRKKERKLLPKLASKRYDTEFDEAGFTSSRRFSNTFDNIKSLLKECRKFKGLSEPPAELANSIQTVSQPELGGFEPRALSLFSCSSVPYPEEQTIALKITSFAEQSQEYNGFASSNIDKGLEISQSITPVIDESSGRRLANEQSRLEARIPVNLLIEDQIVKKALNENRRQLEKVSDAIKEIESVKNSGEYGEGNDCGSDEIKPPGTKSNSLEADSHEKKLLDIDLYETRKSRKQSVQTPINLLVQGKETTDEVVTASTPTIEHDFDIRRINGADMYASGRRPRVTDLEIHMNDTKQIENVIDAILEDSKNPKFQVSVEVLDFPPLPPSPVEEADEENSDVGSSGCNGILSINNVTATVTATTTSSTKQKQTSHPNRTMEYRPRVPPHQGISFDSSKEQQTASLNTRSVDAVYARGHRTVTSIPNARREVPVERRTLPTDLPGPSRRRPLVKKQSPSTEACSSGGSGGGSAGGAGAGGSMGSGMQTSCSLPETPVFARGSDIPRTPQHVASNPTQSRRQPGWYAATTVTTGYRRNNPCLEQAIIGTELLRLAGGPNRGWYPTRKSNQPRPASIEHLERLNSTYDPRLPGSAEQRKPLTLPTNITPNKYFGQSKHSSTSSTREALRRVTSLLIKKGANSKDGKSGKDNLSPSGPYAGVETSDAPKKKGFFKNFWKRSRHYSLENQ